MDSTLVVDDIYAFGVVYLKMIFHPAKEDA